MKTYEITLRNKENTLETHLWIHRSWRESMKRIIDIAIKEAEEDKKLVVKIERID